MADTKKLIASVGGSIARPGFAVGNGELNKISDFEVAASYNWLDEKNPTILVPGVPPMWSPPATAPALKPDSGPQHVDQNTNRNPGSPFDSLILAVQTYQPDFDFAAVDVFSDRRPLHKLYGFVTGEPEAFEFGVETVSNTALLIRIEKQTREELPSTPSMATVKRSKSRTCEGARLSEKEDAGNPLNHVNFVKTLSLGSRVASPTETKEKPNGRVTVVRGGQKVPHAAVLELTTRFQFAKRPFDVKQKLADFWISQTPNFIEAYHRSVECKTYNQLGPQQGKFEDIKVKSIGDQLAKWETANAVALGKPATVLGQVAQEAKKARGPCIVTYMGRSQCWGSRAPKPCQACPRI